MIAAHELNTIARRVDDADAASSEMQRTRAYDRDRLLKWLGDFNKDHQHLFRAVQKYADSGDFVEANYWAGGPSRMELMATYTRMTGLLERVAAVARKVSRVHGKAMGRTE